VTSVKTKGIKATKDNVIHPDTILVERTQTEMSEFVQDPVNATVQNRMHLRSDAGLRTHSQLHWPVANVRDAPTSFLT
jgi:hypothetical protein